MGWWRSGVIPATALVIGNQTMDDRRWELSYKSLLGTLPIMPGDARKVKKGGIVGIFRQGGIDGKRKIKIPNLLPGSNYLIKDAPSGKLVYKMTGKQIFEDGFVVRINEKYGA